MPEFTVIIPVYCRPLLIQRAVRSVLNQVFSNFELIIVDDGSTDTTLADLKKYLANEPKQIDVVSLSENRGVSFARNRAIEKAKGKYVAFLDSDDEWMPHKLLSMHHFFLKNPEILWVHSNEDWLYNERPLAQQKKHLKAGGWQFERSTELCVISPSAVCLQTAFIQKNLFDENFPVCEDYDLWLRLTRLEPIGFIEDSLILKRGGHSDQLSKSRFDFDLWRVRALAKQLGEPGLRKAWRDKVCFEGQRKLRILEKGARKHQNQQILDECERVRPVFFSYLSCDEDCNARFVSDSG